MINSSSLFKYLTESDSILNETSNVCIMSLSSIPSKDIINVIIGRDMILFFGESCFRMHELFNSLAQRTLNSM